MNPPTDSHLGIVSGFRDALRFYRERMVLAGFIAVIGLTLGGAALLLYGSATAPFPRIDSKDIVRIEFSDDIDQVRVFQSVGNVSDGLFSDSPKMQFFVAGLSFPSQCTTVEFQFTDDIRMNSWKAFADLQGGLTFRTFVGHKKDRLMETQTINVQACKSRKPDSLGVGFFLEGTPGREVITARGYHGLVQCPLIDIFANKWEHTFTARTDANYFRIDHAKPDPDDDTPILLDEISWTGKGAGSIRSLLCQVALPRLQI